MNTTAIKVIESNIRSNFPFWVRIKKQGSDAPASEWPVHQIALTLKLAQDLANELTQTWADAQSRNKDVPAIEVCIEHCKGGPSYTDRLPEFKTTAEVKQPYDVPVWSGKSRPPAIGSKIPLNFNSLGQGTVLAYGVMDGYLGVFVQLDPATRPDWHKRQNPQNEPGLLFGIEVERPLLD